MKTRFLLLAVLFSLTSGAFAASRTSDVTKALTAEYTKYVKAFADKNIAVIERQILPEFTARIQGQTLNRRQLLERTAEAMDSTLAVDDMCIKIKRLSVKGNVATAVVTETAHLTVGSPNEQPREIFLSDLRRDTWVRTASGWKLKRTEMLKSSS